MPSVPQRQPSDNPTSHRPRFSIATLAVQKYEIKSLSFFLFSLACVLSFLKTDSELAAAAGTLRIANAARGTTTLQHGFTSPPLIIVST